MLGVVGEHQRDRLPAEQPPASPSEVGNHVTHAPTRCVAGCHPIVIGKACAVVEYYLTLVSKCPDMVCALHVAMACAWIRIAALSPAISDAALVLPWGMVGKTDASATRSPVTP